MLALAAATALAGSAVQASVIPQVVLVSTGGAPNTTANPQLSANALADDPSLSGYCTYDLQVVVSSATGQDRWASGDLRAQLGNGGLFYVPPGNTGDPTVPTDGNYLQAPGVRNLAGQRFLQADTMVMSPVGSASRGGILGKSTFAPASQSGEVFPSNGSNFLDPNDPNQTTFEPANDMSLVDAAWTTSVPNNTPTSGTFTVARLTVKTGSTGTFIGRIGSLLTPSSPVSFTYFLGGAVPEPTSVALLGLGLGAVALRRRK